MTTVECGIGHRPIHIYSRCRNSCSRRIKSCRQTLISLPLQMAERLLRAQPASVANHVKARQSLVERAVTWLATECGRAGSKRSAICSGKVCRGFIIVVLAIVVVVVVVVLLPCVNIRHQPTKRPNQSTGHAEIVNQTHGNRTPKLLGRLIYLQKIFSVIALGYSIYQRCDCILTLDRS